MWKYRPEYDTRETNEEQCFDCDYRLGEVPGEADFISKICENENSVILMCVPVFYANGDRNYDRHIRSKRIHPYIKLRKLDSATQKIIGVCRISLVSPKYITGYNEDMTLSKEELNEFIQYINSVDGNFMLAGTKWAKDAKISTGWHKAISKYNHNCKINNVHYHVPKTIGIPDYTKLYEET